MPHIIDFGQFALDCDSAIKQLKQDMKDDWFPDPLGYQDMLDYKEVAHYVMKAIDENHGMYSPSGRQLENIPKEGFTIRYALETSLHDRILYHGLTSLLVPFFDETLSWRVFSHRYNPNLEKDERYIFKHSIRAWQDFLDSVRAEAKTKPVLLTTDLSNYFESIRIPRLKQNVLALLPNVKATGAQKGQLRAIVEVLFECLPSWTFESEQGLPQNRDASSFLGNLMMSPVDAQMEKMGFEYFRYMDDIRVLCKDHWEARHALKTLIIFLRGQGLSVNSRKTKIIASDHEDFEKEIGKADPRLAQIESMWRSRSRPVIWRSFQPLKQLTSDLISEKKVGEREFRFCIHRLKLLALCADIATPAGYFDDLTDYVLEQIIDFPATTDNFISYLAAVPLAQRHKDRLVELAKSESIHIYGWQAYRLWTVLVAKGIKEDVLIEEANKQLQSSSKEAVRAGAALYLGAFGAVDDKVNVAKSFGAMKTFFSQRHALIAIHELPYRPHVEKFIKPHIRADLLGVYRRLKEEFSGTYLRPPEPIHYKKIYDEGSAYE